MMKNKLIKFGVVLMACLMLSGCGSKAQAVNVKVYDYSGSLLAEYKGNFNVYRNGNAIFFSLNGKKVLINNAIVIIEEK